MAASLRISSSIRSMAPAAFCTSPQLSPSAPTAPAAKTDSSTNCNRAPGVIRPAITSWAPSHSTRLTPPNITTMIIAVMKARALIRTSDTAKAASTAAPKRSMALASRPKACTVSIASTLSPAKPTALANRSCEATVSFLTVRPNRKIGPSSSGTTSSTMPVSLGLTTNSSTVPPIRVRKLRRANDTEVVSRVSTRAMSVVRRDSTSPVRIEA